MLYFNLVTLMVEAVYHHVPFDVNINQRLIFSSKYDIRSRLEVNERTKKINYYNLIKFFFSFIRVPLV